MEEKKGWKLNPGFASGFANTWIYGSITEHLLKVCLKYLSFPEAAAD